MRLHRWIDSMRLHSIVITVLLSSATLTSCPCQADSDDAALEEPEPKVAQSEHDTDATAKARTTPSIRRLELAEVAFRNILPLVAFSDEVGFVVARYPTIEVWGEDLAELLGSYTVEWPETVSMYFVPGGRSHFAALDLQPGGQLRAVVNHGGNKSFAFGWDLKRGVQTHVLPLNRDSGLDFDEFSMTEIGVWFVRLPCSDIDSFQFVEVRYDGSVGYKFEISNLEVDFDFQNVGAWRAEYKNPSRLKLVNGLETYVIQLPDTEAHKQGVLPRTAFFEFSDDLATLVAAERNWLRVYSLPEATEAFSFEWNRSSWDQIRGAKLFPSGESVAVIHEDKEALHVSVFDMATGTKEFSAEIEDSYGAILLRDEHGAIAEMFSRLPYHERLPEKGPLAVYVIDTR